MTQQIIQDSLLNNIFELYKSDLTIIEPPSKLFIINTDPLSMQDYKPITIKLNKDAFLTKEQLFFMCLHNKLSLTIIDKDNNKYTFINGNWTIIEYKDTIITFEYDYNNTIIKRTKTIKN